MPLVFGGDSFLNCSPDSCPQHRCDCRRCRRHSAAGFNGLSQGWFGIVTEPLELQVIMRGMGPHATTETLLCGINTFGGVAKERGTVIASMPGAGTWS